jgi:hypothetical protein
MNISERDLGWLEGLIDGEGCLSLTKARRPSYRLGFQWTPLLTIANTNQEIIQRARKIIGFGNIFLQQRYDNLRRKPVYHLQLSSGQLRALLPELKLTGKERQRKLLLKFLSKRRLSGRRSDPSLDRVFESIWIEIKKLNKPGRVEVVVKA